MSGKRSKECIGCCWNWGCGAFRCHHCIKFRRDKALESTDNNPVKDRYDDTPYIEPWNIDDYLEN